MSSPGNASDSGGAEKKCIPKTIQEQGFDDPVTRDERLALEARGLPTATYTCLFSDPERNAERHCGFTDESSSGPYFVANTPMSSPECLGLVV